MSRTRRNEFRGSKYWVLANSRIMYDFKFDPIKAYLESTQGMIFNKKRNLTKNITLGIKNTRIILKCQTHLIFTKWKL
ncbi:hypothetical protein BST97_05640 [Nonlabens spongiae]|uniref:Uncharacterized protein n=1 Tax=Nonlabens spongiae TaxID=331648 RepID=A0A1W6MJ34_9FLAO|nr:hypothetical protein BST97_05640 [Nonlabens spongiae]